MEGRSHCLRPRSYASLLAGFFNYVAVAWLVLQLTGSNLAVGAVLAAASVPLALFMLLGGAVSDRFSPRTTCWRRRSPVEPSSASWRCLR
jgi:MFS family permease